jgi:hypothetical protein
MLVSQPRTVVPVPAAATGVYGSGIVRPFNTRGAVSCVPHLLKAGTIPRPSNAIHAAVAVDTCGGQEDSNI